MDGLRAETENGQEWMVHRQGYRYPLAPEFWQPQARLELMDRLDIDVSLLSLAPTLLLHWLDVDSARDFCRRTNDALAEVSAESGGRLYGLAALPMQDPGAAARELRRAVQELGLRGALVGTTIEKVPLDDPRFAPVLAAADELRVPLLLHPYDKLVRMRGELRDFYLSNLIGIPLATTLAATRLILSGSLDLYPHLTVVLMHAGGFLPYQVGRLDHGYRVREETGARIEAPPSTYLRRFFFDTITHNGQRLRALVEWIGADRVVLGTDIPFDMADTRFDEHFAEAELDEATRRQIAGANARQIFGISEPETDSVGASSPA